MIGVAPASISFETLNHGGSVTNVKEQAPMAATHVNPITALNAYIHGAVGLGAVSKACHLGWSPPAAICEVESDPGCTAGNELAASGVSRSDIIGPVLKGNGFARVGDAHDGSYDRDSYLDRPFGLMQFICPRGRSSTRTVKARRICRRSMMRRLALASTCALSPVTYRPSGGLRSSIRHYNYDDSNADRFLAIRRLYASAGAFSDAGSCGSPSFDKSAGAKHRTTATKPSSPRPNKKLLAATPAILTQPSPGSEIRCVWGRCCHTAESCRRLPAGIHGRANRRAGRHFCLCNGLPELWPCRSTRTSRGADRFAQQTSCALRIQR